jgi:hypothetical protein
MPRVSGSPKKSRSRRPHICQPSPPWASAIWDIFRFRTVHDSSTATSHWRGAAGEINPPGLKRDRSPDWNGRSHFRGREQPSKILGLLKRWTIHARLIVTPGLIRKSREPPPIGKRRIPSPRPVIAVPLPGSVIAAPSAAIAIPPTMSDRMYSHTTLISRIDVGWCNRCQSPARLGQEQASGNTRCCKKGQLLKSDHFNIRSSANQWRSGPAREAESEGRPLPAASCGSDKRARNCKSSCVKKSPVPKANSTSVGSCGEPVQN